MAQGHGTCKDLNTESQDKPKVSGHLEYRIHRSGTEASREIFVNKCVVQHASNTQPDNNATCQESYFSRHKNKKESLY